MSNKYNNVKVCHVLVFPQSLSVKVTPGKVKAENRKRAEQEEKAEEKRLAIMMMKKKEKYLYDKIMFGKKRHVREVSLLGNTCVGYHLICFLLKIKHINCVKRTLI